MITIKIADLPIGINNKYSYIEKMAADYLTDEPPIFTVEATEEQIRQEAGATEYDFPDAYLESIVIYRNIADILPSYDAFVFHGAILNYEGEAYAFTAKSGVGKTTHTRLWLREFGDEVHILNGDKPILRVIDGKVWAAGTPWRGKENYGVPEMLPLSGIAFLERAEKPSAEPIGISEALIPFINQIYVPESEEYAPKALSVANKVISSVPMTRLRVDMSPESATVAKEAFLKRSEI